MSQQTPDKRAEFRARPFGFELRDDGGEMPTLVGHLAVFNQWAEINSVVEGHFLERIDPGAFTKTIMESRDSMRVLFQHGKDPTIGDKPLGPIRSLEVDAEGLAYEVPLLDTSYNRDIVAMLSADPPVLGSSFRFKVMRESVDRKPTRSDHNPRRLPERTVQEVRMQEFGPVTFPAYSGAKAGLRSLTDRMMLPEARMDTEDLGTLACMITMGIQYIDEQDEPGDAANIPVMQEVLKTLQALTSVEIDEDEPLMEPEDEGMASSDGRNAPPTTDAAQTGTSTGTPRTTSWQFVPSLNALHVAPKAEESLWNRTT
jgi:HK97 family phage prohead protease